MFTEEQLKSYFAENMAKEKKDKIKLYHKRNAYCEKKQTVFVGSSLMEQFPINEYAQGIVKDKIYNRGVSASVTTEFLENIDVLLLELQPTRIFINIGTNDMFSTDYSLERLLVNYNFILKSIQDKLPSAQIYIMAFYPMNEAKGSVELFGGRTNKKLNEANAALCALSKKYVNCKHIDVSNGLRDKTGSLKAEFTIDGIHLYPEAYAIVFDNLKRYLTGFEIV